MITTPRVLALLLTSLVATLLLPGCSGKKTVNNPVAPTGQTFRGPGFLRGTVGSYASFNNADPQMVSGYGLVVGLRNTGSAEVPAYLREWLMTEMRRQGVGSPRYADIMPGTPAQILARPDTAVVEIVGLRPPAAPRSSRFDLLVRPADSQTTSLAHGFLWTAQLAPGPLDDPRRYTAPVAVARGPIYLDPLNEPVDFEEGDRFERFGVIASGGVSTEDRKVELVLNEPSWSVARVVSDRINERFPMEPTSKFQTAVPRSSLLIEVNVPKRYETDPERFLNLVQYLYTQKSPNFATQAARDLMQRLADDEHREEFLEPTSYALQGLGPNIIPVLRDYYLPTVDHDVRMAALESGALLGDSQAVDPLIELAGHGDPEVRARLAKSIVKLPRSAAVYRAINTLLDDRHRNVRIATYEALADRDDPIINRLAIREPATREIKFIIDRVPTRRPLIYVTHEDVPRLAVFNPGIRFSPTRVGAVWNNQLMMRMVSEIIEVKAEDEPQPDGQAPAATAPATQPQSFRYLNVRFAATPTKVRELKVAPDVPTLAYVLGHTPSPDDLNDGLRLSFGEVVDVVHAMVEQGVIDAPIHIQPGALAQAVKDATERDKPINRQAGPAVTSAEDAATAPESPEGAQPENGDGPTGRFIDGPPNDSGVLTLPDE